MVFQCGKTYLINHDEINVEKYQICIENLKFSQVVNQNLFNLTHADYREEIASLNATMAGICADLSVDESLNVIENSGVDLDLIFGEEEKDAGQCWERYSFYLIVSFIFIFSAIFYFDYKSKIQAKKVASQIPMVNETQAQNPYHYANLVETSTSPNVNSLYPIL